MKWPKSSLLLPLALLAIAGLGAAAVLFQFDPSHSAFYPTCQFHRLTGLECPGCGSLRAMHQLLHGRLAAAFHFNALLVVSLPLLAWWGTRAALGVWNGRPLPQGIRPVWLWGALAVVVAFGVLRNLPLTQLAWLSPQP